MNAKSKQLIAQALRLLAVAVEEWDSASEEPVEPARLLDKDRVEKDKARSELRRRGII